jgi:hypothetical protein
MGTQKAAKVNHAEKLFTAVLDIDGVKDKTVGNGTGLWVGKTRILKRAKTGFDAKGLLFPRPPIKTLVAEGDIDGKITDKNVAFVIVTAKNYNRLLKGIEKAIEDAKARAEKTAKKKATKAKTSGKSSKKKVSNKGKKRTKKAQEALSKMEASTETPAEPTEETVNMPESDAEAAA